MADQHDGASAVLRERDGSTLLCCAEPINQPLPQKLSSRHTVPEQTKKKKKKRQDDEEKTTRLLARSVDTVIQDGKDAPLSQRSVHFKQERD